MNWNRNTSWRKEIAGELQRRGESWTDVIGSTLTDEQLDREFNPGFGAVEGTPFTLWTERHVYFPVGYDGAEGVASVPRNPCDEATRHVGDS